MYLLTVVGQNGVWNMSIAKGGFTYTGSSSAETVKSVWAEAIYILQKIASLRP